MQPLFVVCKNLIKFRPVGAVFLLKFSPPDFHQKLMLVLPIRNNIFHHPSLLKVKRLDPAAKTGLLYSDGWIHVASYGKKLGVDALHPALYHLRSGKLLKEAKEKKLPLHVWTVNEEGAMRVLAEQKIAAMITNYPDVALRVVREMNRH